MILALREQCIHWAIFSTTLFSIPKLFENSKKSPKGIDKTKIRFIIEWWGIVGKKGKMERTMTESVESEVLSGVSGSYGHGLNILRVLLFYPVSPQFPTFYYKPYLYFVNTLWQIF